MGSAKPLLMLALSQGSARSSLIDAFFLRLSPGPTRRHFPHRHFTRRAFLATLLAAILLNIVLVTWYCTTSHRCSCHSERCAKHVTKLATILVASFSPPYLSRLSCHHTRCVLLALILATSYLLSSSPPAPSLTSYSSMGIVQLPGVCHSES